MTSKLVSLQHTPAVSTPVEHVRHDQEGLMNRSQDVATSTQARLETTASRLRELVAHLRHQRAQLREEWARLITEAKLADYLYPFEGVNFGVQVTDAKAKFEQVIGEILAHLLG